MALVADPRIVGEDDGGVFAQVGDESGALGAGDRTAGQVEGILDPGHTAWRCAEGRGALASSGGGPRSGGDFSGAGTIDHLDAVIVEGPPVLVFDPYGLQGGPDRRVDADCEVPLDLWWNAIHPVIAIRIGDAELLACLCLEPALALPLPLEGVILRLVPDSASVCGDVDFALQTTATRRFGMDGSTQRVDFPELFGQCDLAFGSAELGEVAAHDLLQHAGGDRDPAGEPSVDGDGQLFDLGESGEETRRPACRVAVHHIRNPRQYSRSAGCKFLEFGSYAAQPILEFASPLLGQRHVIAPVDVGQQLCQVAFAPLGPSAGLVEPLGRDIRSDIRDQCVGLLCPDKRIGGQLGQHARDIFREAEVCRRVVLVQLVIAVYRRGGRLHVFAEYIENGKVCLFGHRGIGIGVREVGECRRQGGRQSTGVTSEVLGCGTGIRGRRQPSARGCENFERPKKPEVIEPLDGLCYGFTTSRILRSTVPGVFPVLLLVAAHDGLFDLRGGCRIDATLIDTGQCVSEFMRSGAHGPDARCVPRRCAESERPFYGLASFRPW
ncbi:hypothetical protein B7C42_06050 [Nocardia cerradoensis]|uniref:Uncharacterized protein n=1 Tax=Nocardia cerradoensis TaxID=85688 RepID=A0A231GYN4_9NOCA|nr:hypothetical protein B7C42_06050 [Nocardia cerradoensis]